MKHLFLLVLSLLPLFFPKVSITNTFLSSFLSRVPLSTSTSASSLPLSLSPQQTQGQNILPTPVGKCENGRMIVSIPRNALPFKGVLHARGFRNNVSSRFLSLLIFCHYERCYSSHCVSCADNDLLFIPFLTLSLTFHIRVRSYP